MQLFCKSDLVRLSILYNVTKLIVYYNYMYSLQYKLSKVYYVNCHQMCNKYPFDIGINLEVIICTRKQGVTKIQKFN